MRLMLGVVLALTLSTTGPIRGDQSVPSAPPQAAATSTAAISGVVSDAATGRPIAGASVFLSATGPGVEGQLPRTWSSRLTDGRGRFVFVGLPSTLRYTVSASHSSYVLARYEGSSPAGGTEATTGGSVAIALAEGEWKKDADIPGSRVVAVPPGQKDGWVDSRFLAAAAASAAKVSLRAGVSAAQDLRRTEVVVK
jgi:hypothetical protein